MVEQLHHTHQQQLQPSEDVKDRHPSHFSKCFTKSSTQDTVRHMMRGLTQRRRLLPKGGDDPNGYQSPPAYSTGSK